MIHDSSPKLNAASSFSDGAGNADNPQLLYLELMKSTLLDLIYDAVDLQNRTEGRVWPSRALTMVGLKRLDNIQACIEDVIRNNILGDLIETGVWRGGSTIFMRAVLKAYGIAGRRVWVADSFEGLPKPNAELYPADLGDLHYRFLWHRLNRILRNLDY
jgi:hypothetical protein